MKRIAILTIITLIFTGFSKSYAQDSIKASYRNFLTELNVNLFQGELSLNNALNQLKFRYFYSEANALRIGFSVDAKRLKDDSNSAYGTNPVQTNDTRTSTLIGINFGIEHHFAGTKRLSPYVGGELTFGYKSSKHVIENGGTKTTIEGAWRTTTVTQGYPYNSSYSTYEGERGFVSYGINMITGFDFYVARKLFIGYEVEFGFINKAYSDIDITTSASTYNSSATNPDVESKEFSFGPRLINGIRVGYVF